MNKSFLKWAGGKSSILDFIIKNIGYIPNTFVEPFAGSAVVSLNVDANKFVIADTNRDLILVFNHLKKHGDKFISFCSQFFKKDNEVGYYDYRDQFNSTKSDLMRAGLFIYLNRYGFNGLCRYNGYGYFNVPQGTYKKVYFPKEEMFFFYEKTNKFDTEIVKSDFKNVFKLYDADDAVFYCDPPYVPLSDTANFTSYSVGGFSEQDQIDLAICAENSKAKVLISNHDTDFTRELYKNADELLFKNVKRTISSDGENRKSVSEILAIYNK